MQTPALSLVQADPATLVTSQRAPATAASAADLRAALAAAIAVRQRADDNAADAAAAAGRAEALLQDARDEVARLEAAQHEAERAATQARASAISEALRAGSEPPAAPLAAQADPAPLSNAMAALRAIEAAARQLSAEAADARAEAADAARACRDLADEIIAADARALAAEWIAATRLCEKLQDRLTGLARVGEGMFIPRDEQAAILERIDRRKAAIADNRLMIENHNWNGYLDGLSAKQEGLWLDYRRRLMNDASAVFEGGEERGPDRI